jgi:DNA repair exonuclease SbcCD ATPase subunit
MLRDHKKKVQELKLRNEYLGEQNHESVRKLSQALQELGSTRDHLNAAREKVRQLEEDRGTLAREVAAQKKALEASEKAQRSAESERDEARGVAEMQAARLTTLEQSLAAARQVRPENGQRVFDGLTLANQALEQTNEKLRTELTQVKAELAHWAKWSKVFEENARPADDETVGAQ